MSNSTDLVISLPREVVRFCVISAVLTLIGICLMSFALGVATFDRYHDEWTRRTMKEKLSHDSVPTLLKSIVKSRLGCLPVKSEGWTKEHYEVFMRFQKSLHRLRLNMIALQKAGQGTLPRTEEQGEDGAWLEKILTGTTAQYTDPPPDFLDKLARWI